MEDNGLLQFYKNRSYNGGFLNLGDIPELSEVKRIDGRISLYSSGVGSFYKKGVFFNNNIHKYLDPEILLSQIYKKAGLDTAIYLPTKDETTGRVSLFSNDVSTSGVIPANGFIVANLDKTERSQMDFLNTSHTESLPMINYFTRRCLQQQTKLRVLDTASYNTDRHNLNFFYKLLQPQSTSTLEDNSSFQGEATQTPKADGIVCIDYEQSAINTYTLVEFKESFNKEMLDYYCCFQNEFSTHRLSKTEMLEQFSKNEYLAELLDKPALAEEIASLDPVGVAEDIKQTIGYEVDPQYSHFLQKSFDDVADALVQ